MAAVEVQVAAAESCAAYFEDGIGGLLDLGDGSVFDFYLGGCQSSRGRTSRCFRSCSAYFVVGLEHHGSHCLWEVRHTD